MNKTALKAAFNSVNFSIGFYKALCNTAKNSYSVAYVNNRHGLPVVAVRYSKKYGFEFRDNKGQIIPKNIIYSFLRQTI